MRALVVDDSALMRKVITTMLVESGGFEVDTARNGLDALEAIPRVRPDVVTLDINMPEMDGLTCLATIMREFPLPVVMVSSLSEQGALVTLEALELGAVDFVAKPGGTVSLNMADSRDELVSKVRRAAGTAVRSPRLADRLRRQREQARTFKERSASGAVPGPVGPPGRGHTDLVLVGASTGGPAVLSLLFERLPGTLGAPVVVAQHMPASFTAALAHRLDEQCALTVTEVDRLLPVRAGQVYIAHGDADIVLTRRPEGLMAQPAPSSPAHYWHPSVDRLVASAMSVVEPARMIGVLLTGMGDDGAEQMTRLHQQGGRTIAESEDSAVVWGMPGQLVARKGATAVLDAAQIPTRLTTWI